MFGEATAARNSFTMAEYRDEFGERLSTIETAGLSTDERKPLEWLGIIDSDETFRLPCDPQTGERLPVWPTDTGLNVEGWMLSEFTPPREPVTIFHISDTHLGYQNRVKAGGGGNTQWVRRSDDLAAFQAILHRAKRERVDAVVHTGDLFDHDVDQNVLTESIAALSLLTDHGIPFYFVLGDHDRLATGGTIPRAKDAVAALETLAEDESIVHCTPSGTAVAPGAAIFGVDATGIGFGAIRDGYTLNGWDATAVEFTPSQTDGVQILCLHEPVQNTPLEQVISSTRQQGLSIDIVLIGHEHRPPFDGAWQTDIQGVTVACAGPPIPISSHFDHNAPGYNRIRIGTSGGFSVDRRTL